MKKRILITTQSLIMGGVETALLSLLKFLNNYDVDIDVYVLEAGVLKEDFQKLNNVKFIPVKIPKNPIIYRIKKNLLCSSLYKKYKDNKKKYDVAIAFYGINNYCDMYAAASNAKKKYVWVHNNFNTLYHFSKLKPIVKLRNIIIKNKFKYFDNIVCVSESAKQGFLKVFKSYEDKLLVINNFMDLERLKGRNEKCDIDFKGDNNLIYVGRLADVKRVDVLIEEFKKVIKKVKDANLYIVGDGPEKQKLEDIVKESKLENKAIFLGNQNNPFKYIEQSNIVVTASAHEAYSINSLEALAMKKYFVSANNEGAKDIFEITNKGNLNNGIICNPDKMHEHIINYLKNKDKYIPNFDIKKANKVIEKELIDLLELQKKAN